MEGDDGPGRPMSDEFFSVEAMGGGGTEGGRIWASAPGLISVHAPTSPRTHDAIAAEGEMDGVTAGFESAPPTPLPPTPATDRGLGGATAWECETFERPTATAPPAPSLDEGTLAP